MLNILIPMAGRGSRFAKKGFALPKPLIEITEIPMIRLVIENLRPSTPHRFIFLVLQEHLDTYDLARKLKTWAGENSVIVPVRQVTEGAACTALLAKSFIDNADPLMIANSDQWVDFDVDTYLAEMTKSPLAGLIMTMTASDPKWSYIGLREGTITEVVEKIVISNEATVGIYNFESGHRFVQAAESMIAQGLKVNGEFYVAPVYNQIIAQGGKIGYFNVGRELDGMYGLGTPEDLASFLQHPVCEVARKSVDSAC